MREKTASKFQDVCVGLECYKRKLHATSMLWLAKSSQQGCLASSAIKNGKQVWCPARGTNAQGTSTEAPCCWCFLVCMAENIDVVVAYACMV